MLVALVGVIAPKVSRNLSARDRLDPGEGTGLGFIGQGRA